LIGKNARTADFIVNNNVYLNGAGKFPNQDADSVVDASKTNAWYKRDDKSITISYELPAAVFDKDKDKDKKYPLITSRGMGKVPLANMFMEHPDGKPLDITSDYYGKRIVPANVMPGPFQNIRKGENRFTIRPGNTSHGKEEPR
jgi:hypothetical protein